MPNPEGDGKGGPTRATSPTSSPLPAL
jgi:hypothetical protein